MSGLPARASEAVDGAAPCPVHPYGYHLRPRVAGAGSRAVFRDGSVLGLPARCALLEEELLESDRELDFIDELWVRERAAGSRGFTALTAALTAAALVIAVIDGAAAWTVAGVLGAVATLGVAHAEAAVDRARLRRIRDWHRRVGVPH